MEIKYNREGFNLSLFLEEVVSENQTLRDKISGVYHEGNNLIIYISSLLSGEERESLNLLVENHDYSLYKYPLIMDYVDKEFISFPLSKINFTKHLRTGVILDKSLIKAPNGRPQVAYYTNEEDVNIAKIEWVFHDATGGLFYKKELFLSYYNSDGSEGEKFIIKRKVIDFTIPNQLSESIKERVDARSSIVDEIKAVCSGAIQVATGKTLEETVNLITPFWDESKINRDNFIELAHSGWMNQISTSDLEDEDHTWMNIPVNAGGTTCQQYMLYRLGY